MLALTRKVFTYGLVFLLCLIPIFGIPSGIDQLFELTPIAHLLFLGVIGSALCFVSWNYAVHELGPVKTSVYLYAIPLVTIIASKITLNEEITTVSLAGMALILIGMMFSEYKKSRVNNSNY